MAQYSYTYFIDGTQVTHTDLNSAFEAVRDAINDLTVASLLPGVFNEHHVDTIVQTGGATLPLAIDGHHGLHTYAFSVFGSSIDYTPTTSYGANGGTETTASYTGDRVIIGHPDATGAYIGAGGPLCKITFPSGLELDGSSNCHGMLISLDVEINDFVSESSDVLMLCIQALVGGTWYTITNSERFITMTDKVIPSITDDYDYSVSVRALLLDDTLVNDFGVATGSTVDGVRGMISLVDAAATDAVTLQHWFLSVLPLWMKVP